MRRGLSCFHTVPVLGECGAGGGVHDEVQTAVYTCSPERGPDGFSWLCSARTGDNPPDWPSRSGPGCRDLQRWGFLGKDGPSPSVVAMVSGAEVLISGV